MKICLDAEVTTDNVDGSVDADDIEEQQWKDHMMSELKVLLHVCSVNKKKSILLAKILKDMDQKWQQY